MILVDSSVWIDHLRAGEPTLVELLNTGRALAHPFVIGELACGNLKNRKAVLSLLQDLPAVSASKIFDGRSRVFDQINRWNWRIDPHLL